MNHPAVTEGIGFINYSWPDLGLRVMAERITDDGYAELRFYSANKTDESLLHITRVNLLATTTMNSLAKRLEKNSQDIPWTDVLTYITGKTMEIARRGEPAKVIWPSDMLLEPEYLLKPIIYLHHGSVVFGEKGAAKSLLALTLGYIVQLPFHDNLLGFITREESTPTLYIDYEDDQSTFEARWSALERGLQRGAMPIVYQRLASPIADNIELLQDRIAQYKVGFLVIDSLGLAAGGSLNDPEPAIRYHAALRRLGLPSLTVAHTSKEFGLKRRTIFGSVYFTNLARSVWEVKADPEPDVNELAISLRQTDANYSAKHEAIGLRFSFENDSIKLEKTDLRDTGLSGELPLSFQIKDLLRSGAKTVKEIAEVLEAKEASVRTIINRMAKKGRLVKLGDSWGLKSKI